MNGLVRDVMSIASGTTLSGSARLTNFNPDKILFIVESAQHRNERRCQEHYGIHQQRNTCQSN